jgi:crotonobetainyl-CoA:carnitine CoA-transferase CaiB-like acyl-CoA transferase
MPMSCDRPLSGIRIVDLVAGPLAPITRYLAELGAQVDRIESATPNPADLGWRAANAGKHVHVAPSVDLDSDRLATAHAIVASASAGLDLPGLRRQRPELVTMAVSDFGDGSPLSHWQATDAVLHAMSGELSRSGIRGRAPLLPPGELGYQCAAAQGAYALVVALYQALRTGTGDHLDFSALEGAVRALDPGFGISGSATMGKPAHLLSRERPPKGFQYPILPCADGHVRLCLLAKRQWQGMFRWMGEPAEFAAAEFAKLSVRYKSPTLLPAIAAFFASRTRAELEIEGNRHGVPISAMLTFEEHLASDHVRERGAVRHDCISGADDIDLPNGMVLIDGERMGPCAPVAASFPPPQANHARPFDGLKVLDLGIIVVGAEQGRLLADQGADVVKVESRAYPDGNRQSYLSYGMSVSFAAGHRNKRSLGIDLRTPAGKALFLDLAAQADVILSNFKPGTLEGLGLSYAEISAVNPAIVMADSSAFGASGPWAGRMGYGPLVRAATGLAQAWRYPDDPEGFSDSVTIYPDHVAARVGAMAVVALLIRRLRTGRGGTSSVAQSEVMLGQFAEATARVSRGLPAEEPRDWPRGVYPTEGDDRWCVVEVTNDAQWAALSEIIGLGGRFSSAAERLAARTVIDDALRDWLSTRDPHEAADLLQRRGVPGAPMLRVADLPDHRYFQARGFYRVESHPYLEEAVIAERAHVAASVMPDAVERPAPLAGEQSRTIVREWLRWPADAVSQLVDRAVIELLDPVEIREVEQAIGRRIPTVD